jgi:hypothetical protein
LPDPLRTSASVAVYGAEAWARISTLSGVTVAGTAAPERRRMMIFFARTKMQ